MEFLLRTTILHNMPEFHSLLRKKLTDCTGCVLKRCDTENLEECVENCMKSCVEFKLNFERKREKMLEDIGQAMVSKCLEAPDREQCKREVAEWALEQIPELLESPKEP